MRSIKTKGMVFALTVILIAVSAMGISGYVRIRDILVKEVNNAMERVAAESASHLSYYLKQFVTLSYIVRLPIDCIKIDKSFVQNIASSKEAKTIVSTIIGLCKALRLNVIAEGIENRRELEYLRTKRCDIGQGYYFSKPVMVEEIEKNYFGSCPD